MIQEAIYKISEKQDLTKDEAREVIQEIMEGKTSEAQTAAFLMGLSMKGETIDEITGCAEGMRSQALDFPYNGPLMEIVGTGGDRSNSFNISTTATFVIAGAGIKVAKHGNRSVSSKSGAADVLEALGVKITMSPERCAQVLQEVGQTFLFAQVYHKAMKYVAPVRKAMGVRTIFNVLGPLTNPAHANMQLMGVYTDKLVLPMAKVLENLGVTRGMVVYGQDGLDEISLSAPTSIAEIRDGKIVTYEITPEQFGFERASKEDLVGGNPEDNAEITLDILNGEKGPKRDAVILNAGASIYLGIDDITIEEAMNIAKEVLDSGKAAARLDAFIKASNRD